MVKNVSSIIIRNSFQFMIHFQAKKLNELSDCPAIDYFMNEDMSDVLFVIEGQRLPALKILLIVNNKVFRAMFSENFKESKDRTVVIEETSFEAFKTLILFLYSGELVLKDNEDFKLIDEVCELSDRYDSPRLLKKVGQHLMEMPLEWNNFNAITDIAFNHKIDELISRVMSFIDNDFENIVKKEFKQLSEINDSTRNKLLELMASNYRKLSESHKILKCGECVSCKIINLDILFRVDPYCGRYSSFNCSLCEKKITNFVKNM